jgi:hypothetical protein
VTVVPVVSYEYPPKNVHICHVRSADPAVDENHEERDEKTQWIPNPNVREGKRKVEGSG